jgi:hypothetical protein
MAKRPMNDGKQWTASQKAQLKELARKNAPTRVIGIKMGRTPDAGRNQASDLGVSLKPTNQSPYNRRKK